MPICQGKKNEAEEIVVKPTEQISSGARSYSQLLKKWGCCPEGPLRLYPWAHRGPQATVTGSPTPSASPSHPSNTDKSLLLMLGD